MYLAEFSALAAALCWSFGGLLSTSPTRAFGALRFNRIRLTIVASLLAVVVLLLGSWKSLDSHSLWILMLSAVIGIFIGDTLLYASLKRIGPRRMGVLFTTNAPITVLLGYVFLDETLPLNSATGCFLIMAGVLLAVFCGTRAGDQHAFERVQGSLGAGIGMGFLSALCQSISVLIARPIMVSGVDAVAASALRVGTAALLLNLVFFLRLKPQESNVSPMTGKLMALTAMSGTVGMALGMTFILFALAHGPAGLVSTLSATSPILILPILWIATKQRPKPGAWVGAFLTVVGVACIFSPWVK
jgi:drug/metabolite transporter (DMT)-like permease